VAHTLGHNSPAAAAREVFEPSTDSASLVVPSQKNYHVLGSLGGDVTSGGVLMFLCLLYPALDAHQMGPHFIPSIFTKLRVFRAFDWLSNISASKIMPQKTK